MKNEDARTTIEMPGPSTWRGELGPTLALAAPVVLAELGWVSMGVIDLLMVGHLGPVAIGAVGIGNIVFFSIVVFGMGLLLGLDTLVSRAFGAGRIEECHRWLIQGLYLAVGLAAPLMLLTLGSMLVLASIGLAEGVRSEVNPYLWALTWSTLPLLVHVAFRRYLQAMSLARPVMVALLVANGLKILGNAALVHGSFGFPRLGVTGAGWSSVVARTVMAGILVGYAFWHSARHRTGLRGVSRTVDLARLRRLIGLGLPAALQVTLEVGVFGAAALLAGRLGEVALAAHEVVLNITCVSFMVPLGISSAASVRVGQALGRNDRSGASRAGWVAIGVGVGFMGLCALVLLSVPEILLRLFAGAGGRGDGVAPARHGRVFSAFRRLAGGGDRVVTRAGPYSHIDEGKPRGPLADRFAGWLFAGISSGDGCDRDLAGASLRPDLLWNPATGGLDAGNGSPGWSGDGRNCGGIAACLRLSKQSSVSCRRDANCRMSADLFDLMNDRG